MAQSGNSLKIMKKAKKLWVLKNVSLRQQTDRVGHNNIKNVWG